MRVEFPVTVCLSTSILQSIYINENHISYSIYNSKTTEPVWLKNGEVGETEV